MNMFKSTKHYHAKTLSDAWELAKLIVGGSEIYRSPRLSDAAGYKVYEWYRGTISDLNTRLEINCEEGWTVCLWVDLEGGE